MPPNSPAKEDKAIKVVMDKFGLGFEGLSDVA